MAGCAEPAIRKLIAAMLSEHAGDPGAGGRHLLHDVPAGAWWARRRPRSRSAAPPPACCAGAEDLIDSCASRQDRPQSDHLLGRWPVHLAGGRECLGACVPTRPWLPDQRLLLRGPDAREPGAGSSTTSAAGKSPRSRRPRPFQAASSPRPPTAGPMTPAHRPVALQRLAWPSRLGFPIWRRSRSGPPPRPPNEGRARRTAHPPSVSGRS